MPPSSPTPSMAHHRQHPAPSSLTSSHRTCTPHSLIPTSIRPPRTLDHHRRYLQTTGEALSHVNG
ncbi:hypothetical protein U1Q18_017982, partial [Sarracenia purpurea var. burkii]